MPGCPVYNENWDLSWAQIQALPRSVYQFALEAGPSNIVQNYNANCTAFYACVAPGETVTDYENRVYADLDTGLVLLTRYLPGDVNTEGWVVPCSDLGYSKVRGNQLHATELNRARRVVGWDGTRQVPGRLRRRRQP